MSRGTFGQIRGAAAATFWFRPLRHFGSAMGIRIEVIYALPLRQERVSLDLPSESTALDAIQASGLLRHLPQGACCRIGVWGKPVTSETKLRQGDRVEIYRPLIADPKEIRRDRAAKSRRKF